MENNPPSNSGGSVAKNMAWSVVERVTSQFLHTVLSIILARLLLPEDYASVALVTVFVNLAGTVVSSSFASALIFDKEQSPRRYSTALFAILMATGILYAVLFIAAPWIAAYYDDPAVTSITRVMSILFVLQGVHSILMAYVSKNMLFKKTYKATLIGAVSGAVVAFTLAYTGNGVWALVFLPVMETAISSIILWKSIGFKLVWEFDWQYVKFMVKYCTKFVLVDLLNSLYTSLNSLIIAKKHSKADLAYYTKSYNLPQMLLGSVNTAVSKVLFPVFSEAKSDLDLIRQKLRYGIRLSCFVLMPLMAGLMMVSQEAVVFLFTENWIGMVPYLQIMCVLWAFQPVQICAVQAFKAIGKGGDYLRLEVLKKALSLALLFTFLYLVNNPIAVAWAAFAAQLVSCIVNIPYLKKVFRYTVRQQIADLGVPIALCAAMSAAIYGVGFLIDNLVVRLFVKVFVGVVAYVAVAFATRNESFYVLLETVTKGKIKRKQKS